MLKRVTEPGLKSCMCVFVMERFTRPARAEQMCNNRSGSGVHQPEELASCAAVACSRAGEFSFRGESRDLNGEAWVHTAFC